MEKKSAQAGNEKRDTQPGSARQRLPVRRITSAELFERGNEVVIEHAGREYRLRLTGKGKLILTA